MLLGSGLGLDPGLGWEADLDVVGLGLEQQVGLDVAGTSETSGLAHGLELARGRIVAAQRLELGLGLGLLPSGWDASAAPVLAVSALEQDREPGLAVPEPSVAAVVSSGAQV